MNEPPSLAHSRFRRFVRPRQKLTSTIISFPLNIYTHRVSSLRPLPVILHPCEFRSFPCSSAFPLSSPRILTRRPFLFFLLRSLRKVQLASSFQLLYLSRSSIQIPESKGGGTHDLWCTTWVPEGEKLDEEDPWVWDGGEGLEKLGVKDLGW